MTIKKSLLVGAMGLGMAIGATSASAANITGFYLGNVDGDATTDSAFRFANPFGDSSFPSAGSADEDLFFGDAGTGFIGTGESAVGSFTTGFNFGGNGGPFVPAVLGTSGTGSDTGFDGSGAFTGTVSGDGSDLNFTSLSFAGEFNAGTTFMLAPESTPVFSGGGADFVNVKSISAVGDGNYDVVLEWASQIKSTEGDKVPDSGSFEGYIAMWKLEGRLCTDAASSCSAPAAVPIPAAVWLFGSGLLGLVGVARRKKKQVV